MTLKLLRRLFGSVLPAPRPVLSAEEKLRGTVDKLYGDGSVVKIDRDRLDGILHLGELEVYDIMIHRTAVRAINADDAPADVIRQILDSPYTRMPL